MYCILVAGMPASGKSTIAVRISESLGIPMLSKDSIKEVLFDDLGFHSRAEKVQLGTAAMHILYYAAAQLMKVGKPFILENNFEDASIPGIMALLETHHYTAVTVRLTGDPEAHRDHHDHAEQRRKQDIQPADIRLSADRRRRL